MTWMHALATHVDAMRRKHPGDRLLLVFDIDGTILDMRAAVRHVLLAYDREHGTRWFHGLNLSEITVHENHVEPLLASRAIPDVEAEAIRRWYRAHLWSRDAVLAGHRPFRGVMEVIRWFQLQPDAAVGLNTGRPEALRALTLESLNLLGALHRVAFSSELLVMNPGAWEQGVKARKAEGVRYFRSLGYRVIAAVDNEPANLVAMATADDDGEILFLHADTIFESDERATPRTVRGHDYAVDQVVTPAGLEADLARRVQLVWRAVNEPGSLDAFLRSPIRWGECDVRREPGGRLVVRGPSFEEVPWAADEEPLALNLALAAFRGAGKAVKLDLKPGEGDLLDAALVDEVLELVARYGFDDGALWFNAAVHHLGEDGFRQLAARHPGAVRQCPVDFAAPLVLGAPALARQVLDALTGWGLTRFSLSWKTETRRRVFRELNVWGYEVNVYNVPDLESFLKVALLLPTSLTADFHGAAWRF